MRLCFANPSHAAIREGVAALAEVCRREFGVPARSANVGTTCGQLGVSGMRSGRILCAAAAFVLATSAAFAQQSGVAELAAYQGPDRQQRLVEGAKREKELTFYSSIPPADISAMVAAFDKKYGLKVKVWRADSEGFLQRVLSEARARRFEGRRHGGIELGARAALPGGPAARSEIPLSCEHHRASDHTTPAVGCSLPQPFRSGLQHQSDQPRTACPDPMPSSRDRNGGASSASRPKISIGLPKSSATSARSADCACFAKSWIRTAFPCARAIACLIIWSQPAKCRWH